MNAFFGLAPAIVRSTPAVYGPFITDPKAYYDAATQRFFLTALEIDVDSSTGGFLPASHTMIGVSQTADPTGSWNIYNIDVTNDGGQFGSCPCFGDQPLIGADNYGFYINTNAFTIATSSFRGTQIYAMSKSALASGGTPVVGHLSGLTEAGARLSRLAFNQRRSRPPATSTWPTTAPSISSAPSTSPTRWITGW